MVDERGRLMRFPSRRDYLDFLLARGIITGEMDFLKNPELNREVYLDWLRRGQVGCVFAQLLGRPANRLQMRTVVLLEPEVSECARQIDILVHEAVDDSRTEAATILLPAVLSSEQLVYLLLAPSDLPSWSIEREAPWRKRLTLVGMRVQIEGGVWAEVLGLGPFTFFPPTRQGPITSLEIRTKPKGSKWSKIHPKMRASHLADIKTDDFLSPKRHGILFKTFTPWLRKRVLGGGPEDQRAKAGVTFVVPAAMWNVMKPRQR